MELKVSPTRLTGPGASAPLAVGDLQWAGGNLLSSPFRAHSPPGLAAEPTYLSRKLGVGPALLLT